MTQHLFCPWWSGFSAVSGADHMLEQFAARSVERFYQNEFVRGSHRSVAAQVYADFFYLAVCEQQQPLEVFPGGGVDVERIVGHVAHNVVQFGLCGLVRNVVAAVVKQFVEAFFPCPPFFLMLCHGVAGECGQDNHGNMFFHRGSKVFQFTFDVVGLRTPLYPFRKALAEPKLRNMSRRTGMWFRSSVM